MIHSINSEKILQKEFAFLQEVVKKWGHFQIFGATNFKITASPTHYWYVPGAVPHSGMWVAVYMPTARSPPGQWHTKLHTISFYSVMKRETLLFPFDVGCRHDGPALILVLISINHTEDWYHGRHNIINFSLLCTNIIRQERLLFVRNFHFEGFFIWTQF